jgi:uncharacterized protein YndB with AHSA1/START domain
MERKKTMTAQTKERNAVKVGKTTLSVEPGRHDFTVTHLFDAPREQIFKAMTDPKLIPQWWGPRYLTTAVDKLQARPGGQWRFVQVGASGEQHAFHGVFHDAVSPERLVMTFEYEGAPGDVAMETTTLEDVDGRTLMRQQSVFQTVKARDAMVESGMEEGMNDSMERLAELLAKM